MSEDVIIAKETIKTALAAELLMVCSSARKARKIVNMLSSLIRRIINVAFHIYSYKSQSLKMLQSEDTAMRESFVKLAMARNENDN